GEAAERVEARLGIGEGAAGGRPLIVGLSPLRAQLVELGADRRLLVGGRGARGLSLLEGGAGLLDLGVRGGELGLSLSQGGVELGADRRLLVGGRGARGLSLLEGGAGLLDLGVRGGELGLSLSQGGVELGGLALEARGLGLQLLAAGALLGGGLGGPQGGGLG